MAQVPHSLPSVVAQGSPLESVPRPAAAMVCRPKPLSLAEEEDLEGQQQKAQLLREAIPAEVPGLQRVRFILAAMNVRTHRSEWSIQCFCVFLVSLNVAWMPTLQLDSNMGHTFLAACLPDCIQ